jgi:hypothetical protein
MRSLPPLILAAATAVGALACGGPTPAVPPAPPANQGECKVLDPPATGTNTHKLTQPGLSKLLPGSGRRGPLKLGQMLSMHHVPSDVQWRALPPSADAALSSTVQDPDAAPTTRARAMAGLAIRGAEGAPPVLSAVLLDAKADPTLRRAAARALADAFIEPEGGPVMAALASAAADPEVTLREAVVKALARRADNPAVVRLLVDRKAQETAPLVIEALDAALTPNATPKK